MAAYVIAEIEVKDAARYADYVALGRPLLERYGARVLAAGGEVLAFEGAPKGSRIVVIEFPSLEAVRRWYGSADYAPARAIRLEASDAVVFAVDGLA